MAVSATGSVSAETTIVPGAIFDLRFRVNMKKCTFFVGTSLESRVEETFGHFGHVVHVEKLAHVSLFTKPSQPVFTDHSSIAFNMSVWTRCRSRAGALKMEDTNSCGRLVHAGKGQRQSADLVFEGHFDIEDHVVDRGQDVLHVAGGGGGECDQAVVWAVVK